MIKTQIIEIKNESLSKDNARIFTTLEGENFGGSIKDHMVAGELQALFDSGRLKEGSLISEVSAGSTAVSLAYYGKKRGLRCHLFLPQEASQTTIRTLKDLGAEIHLIERKDLYVQHELFCKQTGCHAFNQLYDQKKSRHYEALGRFIRSELKTVDLIISAVGTGHSVKGVARGVGQMDIITAEPLPPLTVNGVRNIQVDRYGEEDPCLPEDFAQRIFVAADEMWKQDYIETTTQPIWVGSSFQLVLGALRKIAHGKKFPTILALGANNRYY